MRLVILLVASLTSSYAQYFSEGWKPGQPVPTDTTALETGESIPAPTAAPTSTQAATWNWSEFSSKHLDFGRIMTEGPIASALSGVGINASYHLEQARLRASERGWDDRVPFLTDENYKSLVKDETFDTPEEAEKRTWFVIVTIGKQDTMSKLVDEAFDAAYQRALDAGDAPHVRWARVDYLAVTELTTEWMVWKPPTIIVIREKGNSFRFYQPNQIRLRPELLHEFIATEGWKETRPWSGPWAPGGSLQPYLHTFAVLSRQTYNTISMFPRWVILMLTGLLGSLLINTFHRNDKRKAALRKSQLTPAQRTKQTIAERVKASPNQGQTTSVALSASPATKRQGKRR
ncbi:hypothetical protein CTheo_3829 [Ceratobasidium theobromae]|uniref:Transmembrane protein n=1 Tax=Ceratobasidium theobromae TaxID=1582974 RepID=A0A5N5QML4_9AGAM|nr:hypothetical protein CTheo_3829 [Ceratobasidium theobromae]